MSYRQVLLIFALILSAMPAYAAETIKEYNAEIEEGMTPEGMAEEGFNMCALWCAVGWEVESSSFLKAQGPNEYTVEKLNDGDITTAWVEGKEGAGIGECVIFRFPKEKFTGTDSTSFWGLMIVNGYCKNEQTWRENSRVKKIKVYNRENPYCIVNLKDTSTLQEVTFDSFIIKPGDWVKIEILDIYPGTKYLDTAITELIPKGAH